MGHGIKEHQQIAYRINDVDNPSPRIVFTVADRLDPIHYQVVGCSRGPDRRLTRPLKATYERLCKSFTIVKTIDNKFQPPRQMQPGSRCMIWKPAAAEAPCFTRVNKTTRDRLGTNVFEDSAAPTRAQGDLSHNHILILEEQSLAHLCVETWRHFTLETITSTTFFGSKSTARWGRGCDRSVWKPCTETFSSKGQPRSEKFSRAHGRCDVQTRSKRNAVCAQWFVPFVE